MTKKQKLLSLLTIPITIATIAPIATILASCSSTLSSQSDYDTNGFVQNANKKFIDIDGMQTDEVVRKIFASTTGTKAFLDDLAKSKIFEWFAYNTNAPIISKYQGAIKDAASNFENNNASKNNDDVQLALNDKGGTLLSMVYTNTITDLVSQFVDYVFSNFDDAICYTDSSNTKQPIKTADTSNSQLNIFKDPAYVNASTPGQPNKFSIDYTVNSTSNLSKALTSFINYLMDQWIKSELPILTPSILFKNSAIGDNSSVFGNAFFTNSVIGTEGSYKFQYFTPANLDSSSEAKNPGTLYKLFLVNKDNLISTPLKGAIDINNSYTEDQSTKLVTNIMSSYDSLVAPYASAVNYKFTNLILNETDPNVPTSATFNPTSIMGNFIDKTPLNTGAAPTGVFQFPWFPSTVNEQAKPFYGEYADMTGIKETVNIDNSPWIITRNEFGVHIIGIDRYQALQEAANASTTPGTKFKNIIQEIKNTILYRFAQEKYYNQSTLDLANKLKTYLNDNLGKVVLGYITTNITSSENNLFGYINNSTHTNGFLKKAITLNSVEKNLAKAGIDLLDAYKLNKFSETVKSKIYDLQSSYNSNDNPDKWKDNGIAGVLPYTRNLQTGNFDYLLKVTNLFTNNASIANYITTKQNAYANAAQNYLNNVRPASKQNYFNGNSGKLSFDNFHPKYTYDMNPLGTVTRYVYTNNFIINVMLTDSVSTDEEYALFNSILFDRDTKVANNTSFYDFNAMQLANTPSSAPAVPTISTNPFGSDLGPLTTWINFYLNKAINEEYIIPEYMKTLDGKSAFYNGDWTIANLSNIATSHYKKISSHNNLTLNTKKYAISLSEFSNFREFLKSLYWLLDYDASLKTYTFSNFITILEEIVNNDENKVGYFGWSADVNGKYLDLLNQQDSFGTKATNPDSLPTITRDFYTNSYQKADKALFLNQTNPYSYSKAINPFGNYPSNQDFSASTNAIMNNYLGKSKNVYSFTNTTNQLTMGGFLGFQSSSSSYISNSLPNELFNSSQTILGQNLANPNQNFKGVLYRFNTKNNVNSAISEFKKYVNDMQYMNEVTSLASNLIDIKFNFTESQINILKSIFYNLPVGTENNNKAWNDITFCKQQLTNIISNIPTIAYQKLDNDLLWNANPDMTGINDKSTTVFSSNNIDLNEYVVSQFNWSDVSNLFVKNSTNNKQAVLKPTSDGKLLGVSPDTFFKAIIKIALNGSVTSKATSYFNDKIIDKPVSVYQYPLGQKIDKSWIKNSKDFE